MKRKMLILGALFLSISTAQAMAREWTWGGSIGATYWIPEWDHELQGFDAKTSGLYGPVAFLHYGGIGLGIQYYTGKFDVTFGGMTDKLKTDRTDLDLMLSYRLGQIFQVSLLYKQIQFDWNQMLEVKTTIKGLGIGGGATKMFQNGMMLYGFGFYMPDLDYTQTVESAGDFDFDSHGLWVEGGVGYLLAPVHLLAKLGYRYQDITASSDDDDWSEKTRGPRLEVSYYF
jgi:hypothetical protein